MRAPQECKQMLRICAILRGPLLHTGCALFPSGERLEKTAPLLAKRAAAQITEQAESASLLVSEAATVAPRALRQSRNRARSAKRHGAWARKEYSSRLVKVYRAPHLRYTASSAVATQNVPFLPVIPSFRRQKCRQKVVRKTRPKNTLREALGKMRKKERPRPLLFPFGHCI